jgi:ABC-type bacteriocin/lantibiotic exporter with double-glycine peptidase domain
MAFAMLGLIAAFLTLRWMQNKSIADELFEIKDGEIVLQSSGYSCVPASISNILGKFGIKESEKQLAAEMGTTMSGTTDGRVAFLMLKYKIRTKRLKNASITDVHPPAALIVDHPATGPESHMVAFMAMHDGQAEIWDPVQGRVMLTPKDLAAVWHGKALEFDRK